MSSSIPDDAPRMSLTVDAPTQPSPFPSPSSSFLPPPQPGPHEFANTLGRPTSSTNTSRSGPSTTDGAADAKANSANGHAAQPPTPTTARAPAERSTSSTSTSPPATPTRRRSLPLAAHPAADAESPTALFNPKHASLTSSRPAPASPSNSRRASAAPSSSSRHSTTTTASPAASRRPSKRRSTRQSQLSFTQPQSPQSPQSQQPKRRSLLIKIRDFAFPPADARHAGEGPDRHRLSAAARPGADDADEDDLEDRRNSGWGAFKWPGLGSRFWGLGGSSSSGGGGGGGGARAGGQQPRADPSGFVPTPSDFARNFDDLPASPTSRSDCGSEEQLQCDAEEEEDGGADGPLLPGLYRALYAFEPEGAAEMALAEDQVVRVLGRGGGVGWAIAVRDASSGSPSDAGGHALVPESYLELVRLDGDGDDDDEEEAEEA